MVLANIIGKKKKNKHVVYSWLYGVIFPISVSIDIIRLSLIQLRSVQLIILLWRTRDKTRAGQGVKNLSKRWCEEIGEQFEFDIQFLSLEKNILFFKIIFTSCRIQCCRTRATYELLTIINSSIIWENQGKLTDNKIQ